MKKILIFNLILLILVFFLLDYVCFKKYFTSFNIDTKYKDQLLKKIAVSDDFDKETLEHWNYRNPLNIDSNKKSIVFTGCSFTYGTGLKEEETLPYLISQMTDNPIYNLGLESAAMNHTLSLLQLGIFEEKVKKEPALVIFIYADFHLCRLVMPNVIFELNEYLYKIKNEELVRKRPPFVVSRFTSLSLIRENLFYYLSEHNETYKNYLRKLLKLHILTMNKLLHEKYPDSKFMIFVYFKSPVFEDIANDIEKEGIIIVRANEDFQVDPIQTKYLLEDGHPNAEIWQIIAPKLFDIIKKYL